MEATAGSNPCKWEHLSDWHRKLCSECEQQIKGSMFTCNLCDDYHVCTECYNDNVLVEAFDNNENITYPAEHPHMHHAFRLELSNFGKMAFPVHKETCANCGTRVFPGLRYICSEVTPEYGICATCFIIKREHGEFAKFEAVAPTPVLEKLHQVGSAIVMQNEYGNQLIELGWTVTNVDDEEDFTNLGRKIGYALYESPTDFPEANLSELDEEQLKEISAFVKWRESNEKSKKNKKHYMSIFGYDEKHEETIRKLRDEVLTLEKKSKTFNNKIESKFIFVCYFAEGMHTLKFGLICIKTDNGNIIFVEQSGRAYDSWDDFLSRNNLPEGFIVYPHEGNYQHDGEHLDLRFDLTRKAKLPSKIMKFTDMGALGVSVAATVGSVVGLFTPLAPVAAVTLFYTAVGTVTYTMSRSGYHLIDRAIHNENVNPFKSRENFADWLAVAASLASFGAIGGSAYLTVLATQGVEMSQAVECTVNAAIFANFTISGIALTASGYNIFEKVANGERPTVMELFQFSTSVLFFTNSAVNLQTAERMIEKMSKERVTSVKENLRVKEKIEPAHQNVSKTAPKGLTKPMKGAFKWRDNKKKEKQGLTRVNKNDELFGKNKEESEKE